MPNVEVNCQVFFLIAEKFVMHFAETSNCATVVCTVSFWLFLQGYL